MFVHSFGAYFGLACSFMITDGDKLKKFEIFEKGNY